MVTLEEKITSILKELEASSDVSGCAVVSNRGQVMASALHKDVDEKSVAAMAAALISVAGRVGKTLDGGVSSSITITGTDRIVIVNPLSKALMISLAPSNAKLGLVEYEIDNAISELNNLFD